MMERMRWVKTMCIVVPAVLLSVACHAPNDDAAGETPVNVLSRFGTDGKAWLTLDFTVAAHSGGTSRAANGLFADGTDAENAVKTLTLVLFHGTGAEADMRVASTYALQWSPADDGHQQLSDHSETTLQISADHIAADDRIGMMAIANSSVAVTVGTTFASLCETIVSSVVNDIDGTSYYVMSSSPLATANDGSGQTETLAMINPLRLYATAAESQSHPAAGHVYLERAAVKVTVDTADDLATRIEGNSAIDFTTSDLYYSLFNYNTRCLLVRQFDDAWLPYNASSTGFRFVEQTPLPTGRYATYWAHDVNYDTDIAPDGYFKQWNGMGLSDYCAENTFDAAHMSDANTTSVVVALQLNGGADFFTASVTGTDVIYQLPASQLSEEGTAANQSFACRRSPYVATAKTIDEYLQAWLMQTHSGVRQWVARYAGGEAKHLTIHVVGDADTGLATVTVTQTAQTDGQGVTDFEALLLDDYMAENIVVSYYQQGFCYYRVPIRHFGDELTPWTSTASMTAPTPAAAYGASGDTAYLGRYGVVRNNWYQLYIKRIVHIGSPTVTPLSSHADDNIEQLLNTTLSITGWTTHEQDL